MIGAIEFLRKAKAICNASNSCRGCAVFDLCHDIPMGLKSESDLVRKVMECKVKEDNQNV